MSIRNLTRLFKPRSIALIGTGGRPESVGATVGCNLRRGSFAGPIMVVEPDGPASPGGSTSKSVAELPQTPDLAIIASPAETVPGLIAELGSRGCAAALVLTAGFGTEAGAGTLRQAMLDAARPSLLRILGPRSLGVAVPAIGLDATFAPVAPLPGGIAWISQSGAVLTTLVDWATSRSIGFSHVVSLGDMADVDTGDLLDYLAGDSATRSILVYLERVSSARKFMSAARAAARSKPLIVVKSGRFASAREAKPETAGQPDADRIYEAAFQRAGMLRVRTLDAMFAALETLGHGRSYTGDRLAILTNGGGLGMLAADALVERGGGLAILDPATLSALDAVLPPGWSRGNPIDIGADGPAACYGDALERIVADRGVDACLVLNAPQAAAVAAADAVLATTARMDPRARAKVFVSWLGEGTAPDVRTRFETAGLPSYDTPERAVAGFMHMLEYRRNQVLLMRVPPSMPEEFDADRARARTIVEVAHAAGRSWLDRN
jgi:acetyltransferase